MEQPQRQNIEQYREKVVEKTGQVEKPQELLEQSMAQLAKVGGFDLMEVAIDGIQNLNPERKARKRIFLSEDSKKDEREQLKKNSPIMGSGAFIFRQRNGNGRKLRTKCCCCGRNTDKKPRQSC